MSLKRFLIAVLSVCLAVCCSACGKEELPENDTEKQAAIESMTNPLTIGAVTIDLPVNFYVEDSPEGNTEEQFPVAYIDLFPERKDNITFVTTGKKQNPEYYTATAINNILSSELDDFSGVNSYIQGECWGKTTVKVKYTFSYEGKEKLATQYYIFTDEDMYLITFTAEDKAVDAQYEQTITTMVIS